MGFALEELIAILDFSETELDGAEVKMSLDLTRADVTRLQRAVASAEGDDGDEVMITLMAEALRGWNLERDGDPIPADKDGLDSLPTRQVTAIAVAWMEAVVSPPLVTNANTPPGKPQESTTPDGPETSLTTISGVNGGDSHPTLSSASPLAG